MAADATTKKLRWAYLPECEAPPSGWSTAPFTEFCQVIAGQSPPSETYNEKGMGLPFLQGNGDFSDKYPQPKSWCTAPAKLAEPGDTLISVRAPVGEINRADQCYAIGRGLAAIRAKGANAEFIHQAIQRWRWSLQRVAQGTTFDAVTARHFGQLLVAVPDSPDEQAAIAFVLNAVDAAIDLAREAGDQARVARLALMQAAFNYELTSEDQQDTDAGRIPKSWQALKGKQAFSVLTGGNSSVNALRPLRNDDVADAWFMKVDDFNLPANRRQIVTTQIGFVGRKNPTFKLLPIGTVVIAKRGAAILKNRVRTTAVPVALDPNLMALRVRDDILPDFFRYQLEWRNLARYVESSGVPQLNNKDLYPRWFVRAPEYQQREIVELIAAAERHEDAFRSKLQSLEALKKSLMHDLLTGTVRVDPAILQEQQA